MSRNALHNFLRLLKKSSAGAVFNSWWDVDQKNNFGPRAPVIRRKQLRAYLLERLANARFAIVGEAIGDRGGHFTGIPMTSERMLLGKQPDIVAALQILARVKPRRTSKPEVCPHGFSEPTATIVWSTLLKLGVRPQEFVLGTAFPWHSFDLDRGLLSNRTPNDSEQTAGRPVLKAFVELFPCDQIIALGKIAATQLEQLRANACCVRHPASGGAKIFREQMARILR